MIEPYSASITFLNEERRAALLALPLSAKVVGEEADALLFVGDDVGGGGGDAGLSTRVSALLLKRFDP